MINLYEKNPESANLNKTKITPDQNYDYLISLLKNYRQGRYFLDVSKTTEFLGCLKSIGVSTNGVYGKINYVRQECRQ